jgi:hypothetical protein
VQRLHREAIGGVLDDGARKLLAEILDYPGVPTSWRSLDLGPALLPVLPVSFQHGPLRFDFFSAVTVLGTPQDITLQQLRIESFFRRMRGRSRRSPSCRRRPRQPLARRRSAATGSADRAQCDRST